MPPNPSIHNASLVSVIVNNELSCLLDFAFYMVSISSTNLEKKGEDGWEKGVIGLFGTAPPALDPLNLDSDLKKVCQTLSALSVNLLHQINRSTLRFTKLMDVLEGWSTGSTLVESEEIIHPCHWLH